MVLRFTTIYISKTLIMRLKNFYFIFRDLAGMIMPKKYTFLRYTISTIENNTNNIKDLQGFKCEFKMKSTPLCLGTVNVALFANKRHMKSNQVYSAVMQMTNLA